MLIFDVLRFSGFHWCSTGPSTTALGTRPIEPVGVPEGMQQPYISKMKVVCVLTGARRLASGVRYRGDLESIYLDPQSTYLLQDVCKEIIGRSPQRGSSGSRYWQPQLRFLFYSIGLGFRVWGILLEQLLEATRIPWWFFEISQNPD